MSPGKDLPGALVISLDFELHWGMRDRAGTRESHHEALMGARRVIPRILELFSEFEIAATWAAVGFLLARTREEMERFSPSVRARYLDRRLDPWAEPVGRDEEDDPLHFAPSLIERIRSVPRQEVGTHTFSHYFCHEPGQDRESFAADLASACAIGAEWGLPPRSIVFPRNQHNPEYDAVLLEHGVTTYRGLPPAWFWNLRTARESRDLRLRAGRFLDAYVNAAGHATFKWEEIIQPNGLANVAASTVLRPYSDRLRQLEKVRLARHSASLEEAARTRTVYHLWWHPHNFGLNSDENLSFLRALLERFAELRERFGMISVGMAEAAELARR